VFELWTIIATALVTLGATYLAYWLAGKPRLIVFSPNSTAFELKPSQEGAPPIFIRAGQVVVQNAGRMSASRVQFTAQLGPAPWGYNIVPAVDHAIRTGARGEWILEIPYVGPGEVITLQVLNGPIIDTVRSLEGPAKLVPVMHQRIYPKSFNVAALILTVVGLATVCYALYRTAERFVIVPMESGATQP
jgi:hypothetical protein